MTDKPKRITAVEMRASLKARFSGQEYAIAFEVAKGTGAAARRHLDAVAMDLWPSRGLALHGIEIKVSRSDYLREKADPEKAEEVARFCDYFWIAAPVGLLKPDELPMAWGLLERHDNGIIAEKVRAKKTPAEEGGRPFLAAMMRAACRPIDPASVDAIIAQRTDALMKDFHAKVDQAAARKTEQATEQAGHWRALMEAIGENPDGYFYRDAELMAAVKLVMKTGVAGTYSSLWNLREKLVSQADKIGEALDAANVPAPPAKASDLDLFRKKAAR